MTAVVALVVVALPSPIRAQSPIVGVIRADGLVLPYAFWSDSGWSRIQFDAVRQGDVILPREWFFTRPDGGTDTLHATNTVSLLDYHDEWGVLTDLASPTLELVSYPIRRIGLVSSIPMFVIPATSLSDYHRTLLYRATYAALDSLFTSLTPSDIFGVAQREDSVHLETRGVYLPVNQSVYASVFASQILAVPPCPVPYGVGLVTGWARISGRDAQLIQHTTRMAECEFKGTGGEEPHAVFEWLGEYYVLSTFSAWDDEPLLRVLSGDSLPVVPIARRQSR